MKPKRPIDADQLVGEVGEARTLLDQCTTVSRRALAALERGDHQALRGELAVHSELLGKLEPIVHALIERRSLLVREYSPKLGTRVLSALIGSVEWAAREARSLESQLSAQLAMQAATRSAVGETRPPAPARPTTLRPSAPPAPVAPAGALPDDVVVVARRGHLTLLR